MFGEQALSGEGPTDSIGGSKEVFLSLCSCLFFIKQSLKKQLLQRLYSNVKDFLHRGKESAELVKDLACLWVLSMRKLLRNLCLHILLHVKMHFTL